MALVCVVVFIVLYMVSCCLSTEEIRITDNCTKPIESHHNYNNSTCVFPNNRIAKFHCAPPDSDNKCIAFIFNDKIIDIDDDDRVEKRDSTYFFALTTSPEIHGSQLQCIEKNADGQNVTYIYDIAVEYKPLIQGDCSYSQENDCYFINFNFTIDSNPRLTLEECASMAFSTNSVQYDQNNIFGPHLVQLTNNAVTVQYKLKQKPDSTNSLTAVLKASNNIGVSKGSAVCPVTATTTVINELTSKTTEQIPIYDEMTGERMSVSSICLIAIPIVILVVIIVIVVFVKRCRSNHDNTRGSDRVQPITFEEEAIIRMPDDEPSKPPPEPV